MSNTAFKTGPKNSLIDVGNIEVGHAHDAHVKTGVSVIIPSQPARCAVDIRGGGPGTRETDTLQDGGLIEEVHGICLSGGSVYGLAAADSVCRFLGAKGVGYAAGPSPIPVSPIVPSAILFDNANGGDKSWGTEPPFGQLGFLACDNLSTDCPEGAVGAGFGASAGLYPGGLGTASEIVNGMVVAAMIAANPIGSPYMPATTCPWAWPYEIAGEFGGQRPPQDYQLSLASDTKLALLAARQNQLAQSTVIGVIATNAALSQKQLKRLTIMAQDGITMAVQPAHTPLDGDTIFALSTATDTVASLTPVDLARLGTAAARCVARALMRGVYLASNATS